MQIKNRAASLVLATTVLTVIPPTALRGAVRDSDMQAKQEPAKTTKKAGQGSSLTGCVDQQEGKYVLIDDRSAAPIADLLAEGFPTEGFAKHLGHKVTVKGTPSSGVARPVMTVRSIQPVSDTCAPQEQAKY